MRLPVVITRMSYCWFVVVPEGVLMVTVLADGSRDVAVPCTKLMVSL